MLFIKYSIMILGCIGALTGVIIGLRTLPKYFTRCIENHYNGFMLLPFVFSPLSQAVYSLISWLLISRSIENGAKDQAVDTRSIVSGIVIGLVFMLVAIVKSYLGKKACRVISETGKGFHKYLTICGFIETISIFAFVFGIITFNLK